MPNDPCTMTGMSRLDYHHIPKTLDLIAASNAQSFLESHDGRATYAPLVRAFLPVVSRADDLSSEDAHGLQRSYDLVLFYVAEDADRHGTLDHIRSLLHTHKAVVVIAPKTAWEKADFAGIAPALFVNDATGILVYLGHAADVKAIRTRLMRRRVRRQSSLTPTIEAVFKTVRKARRPR